MASAKTSRKVKRKAISADIEKLAKPGDALEGRFLDMKVKMLKGKGKEPAPTRMYYFDRGDGTKRFVVTGKAMFDDLFDSIVQDETKGEFTLDDYQGIQAIKNQWFLMERGNNQETGGDNTLGSYDISLLE